MGRAGTDGIMGGSGGSLEGDFGGARLDGLIAIEELCEIW